MSEFTGICDSQCVHKGLLLIRVRGFPARDILSLCALGDGIGQDNKIVGASSSASFPSVLGLVRKSYTKSCFCREFKE